MSLISPKAIVENPAALANDVSVAAFSYIGPDVKIASGVSIGPNVTIDGKVDIGPGCTICSYAVIGSDSRSMDPQVSELSGHLVIGSKNNIREHAVICCGTPDTDGTNIGDNNLIMTGCYVGPNVRVGNGVVMGNYSSYESGSQLGDFLWSAAFTGVDAGVRIGKYSFTSGYAGIDVDAPPFAMLQGYPYRVRSVNSRNLKRHNFDDKHISILKKAFKLLFSSDTPLDSAVSQLAEWDENEYLSELLAFARRAAELGNTEIFGRS